MVHLLEGRLAALAHVRKFLVAHKGHVFKGAALDGNKLHDVGHMRAKVAHGLHNRGDVVVVDALEQHRVDLADNACRRERPQARQLVCQKQASGGFARVPLAVELGVTVDARPDGGIHGIDGHGGVAHAHALHVLHKFGQGQAVGGHAEGDGRVFGADHLQRAKGGLGIGKGVARPGYAHHRKVGHVAPHLDEALKGLLGRKHGGGHAWAAFVGAVVLAQAVVAAQVAQGRDGQMQPGGRGAGAAAETGVGRRALADAGHSGR